MLSAPGGEFCALQANPGAFGCAGSGAPTATCPGGNVPPVPDYIETSGTPAGAITPGPHPIRLASAFCVPPVGGSLGVLINQAADLPGPGALTLPGTIDVATATVVTTTSTTSTTITPPSGPRLRLTMAPPGGTCGALRAGGAGGTVVKNLSCGGLDIGGGGSTFVEALMPSGGVTEFDADCTGSVCALGALAAADTSSNQTCSTTGCRFGPYVPFSNAGFSLCMAHTLSAPATGTLDTAAGTFVGSIILDSAAYLTSNASMPCPRCVGGAPGVSGSGVCDPAWLSSHGASPNASQPCTPVNLTGDTADCEPAPGGLLSAIVLNLSPLTTAGASDTGPGGGFCPSQSTPGAFGCNGDGSPTSNCPGDAPAVPDYIEVTGLAAGALTPGAHPIRLASTFCIPSAGGSLGAIINSAADLPGPGAITLPATVEFLP